MKVLKWIAIILGGLFVLFLIVTGIGVYWFSSIESVKLAEADFEKGGSYSSEERTALIDSCVKNAEQVATAKDACGCVSDKAATDYTRFDRLMLTASFEGDTTGVLALAKGAAVSGIASEKIPDGKGYEGLLTSCGFGSTP